MPHRATYFFPRQFPERGLDESSKQKLDHEKKKLLVNSIKSPQDAFGATVENDVASKSSLLTSSAAARRSTTKDDVVFSPEAKNSAVSELLTSGDKLRTKQKQIAGRFCDWFVDKKGNRNHRSGGGHHHHHPHLKDDQEEDRERELLLPPTPPSKDVADRSIDRQVSLQRLSSSGSSYAASLFTSEGGTATFSSVDIITKDDTSSSRVSTADATARRHEQQQQHQHEEEERSNEEGYARKYKESYHLQVAFAKRLTFLASLASDPVLTLDAGTETWDAEAVSRRLWVRTNYDH